MRGEMRRRRRYMVDGRITRHEGDTVKFTKRARDEIYENMGIRIKPYELGTITKIQYDISGGFFWAFVRIRGQVFTLTLSDLITP